MVENDYNLVHAFYVFVKLYEVMVEGGRMTQEEAIMDTIVVFGPFKPLLISLLKNVPEEAKVDKHLITRWLIEMSKMDSTSIEDFAFKCKCSGHIWMRIDRNAALCKRPLLHQITSCNCVMKDTNE
jgi:hypothetical protein